MSLQLFRGIEGRAHGRRATTEELLLLHILLFTREKEQVDLSGSRTIPMHRNLTVRCVFAPGTDRVRPVRVLEEAEEQAGDLPGEQSWQRNCLPHTLDFFLVNDTPPPFFFFHTFALKNTFRWALPPPIIGFKASHYPPTRGVIHPLLLPHGADGGGSVGGLLIMKKA